MRDGFRFFRGSDAASFEVDAAPAVGFGAWAAEAEKF
jgi:hypothetical protein